MDGPILDLGSLDTEVVFDLPFVHHFPFYDLAYYPQIETTCNIVGTALTPIVRVDTGDILDIPIRVYASLQNITLDVPTAVVYTSRQISKALTSVSLAAKSLSNVPVIGMYASAFSIASGAAGSIAHLFGFSRPLINDESKNLSLAVGSVTANSGYLEPGSTSILNPITAESDPLMFDSLLMHPGLVAMVTWEQTDARNAELLVIPVSPVAALSNSGSYQYTPLSYFYNMFEFWRGTIVYEFRVPHNQFVKGKLRVTLQYDYGTTPDLTSVPAYAYVADLDLSEDSTFQVHVPYLQAQPYLNSHDEEIVSNTLQTTNPVCKLYLTVLEPLIAPGDTVSNMIIVSHWAGDDFEFSRPSNIYKQYYATSNWMTYSGASIYDTSVLLAPTTFELKGAQTIPTITSVNTAITYTTKIISFPVHSENRVQECMSERLLSIRPLLKAFDTYTRSNTSSVYMTRFNLPIYPLPAEKLTTTANYAQVTHLEYVSRCFLGSRGQTLIAAFLTPPNNVKLDMEMEFGLVEGVPGRYGASSTTNLLRQMLPELQSSTFGLNRRLTDTSLGSINSFPVIQQVPLTAPYYYIQNTREFATDGGREYNTMPCGYFDFLNRNESTQIVAFKYAAGEDYNPLVWNGIPIVYRIGPVL